MKRLGFLCTVVFLAACSKKIDRQASSPTSSSHRVLEKQSCDFGMTSFNLTKRAPVNNDGDGTSRRKKPTGGGTGGNGGGTGTGGTGGGTTTPPPPSPSG